MEPLTQSSRLAPLHPGLDELLSTGLLEPERLFFHAARAGTVLHNARDFLGSCSELVTSRGESLSLASVRTSGDQVCERCDWSNVLLTHNDGRFLTNVTPKIIESILLLARSDLESATLEQLLELRAAALHTGVPELVVNELVVTVMRRSRDLLCTRHAPAHDAELLEGLLPGLDLVAPSPGVLAAHRALCDVVRADLTRPGLGLLGLGDDYDGRLKDAVGNHVSVRLLGARLRPGSRLLGVTPVLHAHLARLKAIDPEGLTRLSLGPVLTDPDRALLDSAAALYDPSPGSPFSTIEAALDAARAL